MSSIAVLTVLLAITGFYIFLSVYLLIHFISNYLFAVSTTRSAQKDEPRA